MGASCWSYIVPYEPDVGAALGRLRQSVFASRSFYSREGVSFGSIEELREEQAEEGTHSILDMRDMRLLAGL